MSSIFVTGGTGFIGQAFLRGLERSSHDAIYCLTRSGALPAGLRPSTSLRPVRGTLRDAGSYSEALGASDIVVHLAAATAKARREEHFAVNAEGTRALLEQCRRSGTKRLLHVSTIAVRFADKSSYPYAQSKELAERAVQTSGLRHVIVRPTIVIGKGGGAWRGISTLARSPVLVVFGDGTARVQPIHVDDLVRCLLHVVSEGRFADEVLELGGPEEATFEGFLKDVHRALRGREPRRALRLPVGPLMKVLAALERPFAPLLPITAGQLAAFCNDTTARPNPIFERFAPEMKRIREMIELAI
ncbi:MAG: NAD-dependent epimerase/dehydratase family protein [Candidatus Binatia bacterium]